MIRVATLDDLDSIVRIEKQFGADSFTRGVLRRFINGNNFVFVAEDDGKIVGYIIGLLKNNSKKVRLYSLIVDSTYRNKGYATELVSYLENNSIEASKTEVNLEVRMGNLPAINFYVSVGYETIRVMEIYYPDGENALKMVKKLKKSE
jgi:ribosomal protein S18 acetylase RimI-like enzyme